MTYEQLIALQERMGGAVNRSATAEQIEQLPVHCHASTTTDGEDPPCCSVCLEDFADGERIRTLPCDHTFHAPCIDMWLGQNRACPICKRDIC